MSFKTTMIALIIAGAPSLSFAMCDAYKHETTASTCAEGQVFDAESNTCVEQVTG